MARCADCIHFSLCDYNTNVSGDSKIKLFYEKGAEKCSFYKPTADVVDVCRCEKCSFYEEVEYYHPTDKNPTKKVCRLLQRQMHPNDYCCYAKRSDT